MGDQNAPFIKGFNSGYLLEQHKPKLLAKALHGLSPSTEYLSGLVEGQKQFQLERNQTEELKKISYLRELGRKGGRNIERE